jgi:hypothetical protein
MHTSFEQESFNRLESLDALAAVRAWLEDDYGCGEDRVLVQAIRRETGIALDDRAIWEVLSEAQAIDATPSRALAALLAAAKPR